METGTSDQIVVKIEPVQSENDGNSHVPTNSDDASNLKEEEVWIKPEPLENSQDSQESLSTIKVEFDPADESQNEDVKTENSTLPSMAMLPPKKRKTLDIADQQLQKIAKEEMNSPENTNTESNEQSSKAEDTSKEKYIMYSYEITKNIQIVTITEEERQEEHSQNVKARQHMRHVCEDCALGFVLKTAYLMHMKVHSKESGDFECDLCHSHLKTADMLYRHKLRHYRRYRCLLCWVRFKDKDTAACHVMTEHVGTVFECDHCGRGFKRPQYLKRHVEQYHTKPHRLECAVCLRVFHERGWYRSHIRTHNEELRSRPAPNPVSCDTCSRVFKDKTSLKRHLQTHMLENLACDICNEKCKNRTVLGEHYLAVHQEHYEGAPEETCGVCLRVCATRAMLKRHMRRMHSDRTKKYQCDHCQRYYLTKGEVRAHIAWSHGGSAPAHACACGRVFRTPALLRDHARRLHQGLASPRVHVCDLCGKAFSNKQVLTRHKKSHSDEMYPCNECGLLFKTQPYVKVHYQLKHLNMTRAQIKAQRKLNKLNKIAQNNIHTRPNWEPSIPNKKKKKSPKEMDPLSVGPSDVPIKIEKEDIDEEIHVPLFQTFVEINNK